MDFTWKFDYFLAQSNLLVVQYILAMVLSYNKRYRYVEIVVLENVVYVVG